MKRIHTNLSAINKFSGYIVEIDKANTLLDIRRAAFHVFGGSKRLSDFQIPLAKFNNGTPIFQKELYEIR